MAKSEEVDHLEKAVEATRRAIVEAKGPEPEMEGDSEREEAFERLSENDYSE